MISIVNICNSNSIEAIDNIILKLNKMMNNISLDHVNNDILNKNTNPLDYDQLIYYDDLNYYDKIFYLYNYIISKFYDNTLIDFSPIYTDIKYTNYTIFFEETDKTFNISDPYIGPTLITNFNIFDDKNEKKYFQVKYYISPTLKNIYTILNYFSKIVGDNIDTNGPFNSTETIYGLYSNYLNNNTAYNIICGLLKYITFYSSSFGLNVSPQILQKIMSNEITKVIYENIHLFMFLLINIGNTYNLSNLISGFYSKIVKQVYLLSTDYMIDPNYEVVLLPNILKFKTNTYMDEISINELIDYTKGVLKYNIQNSDYYNFSLMIDEQHSSYIELYKTLTDTNDIGITSQSYVDYYNHFFLFTFEAESIASTYLFKKSLSTNFNINSSSFKTNNTLFY